MPQFSSLADDELIEILVKLPVKSVLRVRSVCKRWCNIIDSSAFRKSHFINQSRNNDDDDDLLFLQLGKSRDTCELSSTLSRYNSTLSKDFSQLLHEFLNVDSWNFLTIGGPINGLICLYDALPIMDELLGWSVSIAICNPCLGEVKILPPSPVCKSLVDSVDVTNIWYETCFHRIIGFGFDPATKDYKVVQLIWSLDERAHIEVYSGRSNAWRSVVSDVIGDGRPFDVDSEVRTTYNTSGTAAYWQIIGTQDDILSFDMRSELFGMIRLPESLKSGDMFVKDDDSLVVLTWARDASKIEVWELGKERDWSHVKNVNIQPYQGEWLRWAVALWKYGIHLRSLCGDHKYEYLILYDTKKEPIELPIYKMIIEYKCTFNTLDMFLN